MKGDKDFNELYLKVVKINHQIYGNGDPENSLIGQIKELRAIMQKLCKIGVCAIVVLAAVLGNDFLVLLKKVM